MLVNMKEILDKAKIDGYAVAAPNVWDEYSIRMALQAAEEQNAPIILDFVELMGDIYEFGRVAVTLSKNSRIPIAINLDHGSSFETAMKAIRAGFTSIMVDRSTLSFDENVKQVKEITRIAHILGVSVEAELGHVGSGEQYDNDRNAGLTNPEEANEFVRQTEIDCLAVAIGTAHGVYKGTPYIDFERLEKLEKFVDIPLVLHGGSGTGDEALIRVVKSGIRKVNLYTDLSTAGCEALKSHLAVNKNISLFSVYDEAFIAYKQKLVHYIQLFGSTNKA
jgi:fructose-bisphosphate aldolase class II